MKPAERPGLLYLSAQELTLRAGAEAPLLCGLAMLVVVCLLGPEGPSPIPLEGRGFCAGS